MLTLNDDIVKEILTYLDMKSLISLSEVNVRLNRLISDENGKHWRQLCKKHWLNNQRPDDSTTWKQYYQEFYNEFGEFVEVYAQILPVWTKFKLFIEGNCPVIAATLNPGLSNDEANEIQKKNYDSEEKFPKSLKFLYRLFNGQKVHTQHRTLVSLFGGSHQFLPSVFFLDFQNACTLKTNALLRLNSKNKTVQDNVSIYPICCSNEYLSGSVISLVLHNDGNTVKEYVTMSHLPLSMQPVHNLSMRKKHNYKFDDYYILSESFVDWLISEMDSSINGIYPVEHDGITNCKDDPGCVAKTGNITVKVGNTFCLDSSGSRYFVYRITMSMDQKADPRESCRLETRHWEINDYSTRRVSHVNGRGVVGQYPTMTPGGCYSWISCTFFAESGSMKGYFAMRVLETDEIIHVKCPEYFMNVPRRLSSVLNEE